MRRLVAVPSHVARHKVRDIRSAGRHRPSAPDPKVVDLRAFSGRNVFRLPEGPTPAA